jgi:hypothetical protein
MMSFQAAQSIVTQLKEAALAEGAFCLMRCTEGWPTVEGFH